jgi:hypothetical protein
LAKFSEVKPVVLNIEGLSHYMKGTKKKNVRIFCYWFEIENCGIILLYIAEERRVSDIFEEEGYEKEDC